MVKTCSTFSSEEKQGLKQRSAHCEHIEELIIDMYMEMCRIENYLLELYNKIKVQHIPVVLFIFTNTSYVLMRCYVLPIG